MDLFVWLLVLFAWVAWQIFQRALKTPKPLGTARGEAEAPEPGTPEAVPGPPPDNEWGRRHPLPPRTAPRQVDPPSAVERFDWERHAAQSELAAAREMGRRQLQRRLLLAEQRPPRRHPRRPMLHTHDGLRDAVVAATVLGPCRALERYEPPG